MRRGGRAFAAVVGAGLARGYLAGLAANPPGGSARWQQQNYADRSVSRLGGPALALGALTTLPFVRGDARTRAAAALAIATAAAVGVYDDLVGDETARGLAGHGAELASGRVTTGAVKVVCLGSSGLLAGLFLRRHWREAVPAGVLIAGCANLGNLLDLRPGRTIKAALAAGLFALPGPSGPAVGAALGAAAGLLPGDLKEHLMLGDGGAGALGAAVGVGLAAGATPSALRRMTALVTALVLSSEIVSFNGVIEAVPALRRIDRLGRQR